MLKSASVAVIVSVSAGAPESGDDGAAELLEGSSELPVAAAPSSDAGSSPQAVRASTARASAAAARARPPAGRGSVRWATGVLLVGGPLPRNGAEQMLHGAAPEGTSPRACYIQEYGAVPRPVQSPPPYGQGGMTRTTPATGTGAPPRAGSWHAGGGASGKAASGGPLCGVHRGRSLPGRVPAPRSTERGGSQWPTFCTTSGRVAPRTSTGQRKRRCTRRTDCRRG